MNINYGDRVLAALSWQNIVLIAAGLALLRLAFPGMSPGLILLQVSIMLAFARALGWLARHLGQPAVLGEILGGIILGPTVFGMVAPKEQLWLFPTADPSSQALHVIAYLGIIAFVFVAGLEVDIASIERRSKGTILTSIMGIILPFALGFGIVVLCPGLWNFPSGDLMTFALFMGTALSISALPVIARILLDLGLLNRELGTVIMAAATIDDMVGWSLFAFVLNRFDSGFGLAPNLGLTVGLFSLTVYVLYNKIRKSRLPKRIELIVIAMLAISVVSEFLGMHAIFGAFLAGIVLSLKRESGELILKKVYPLVIGVFAPIYFVSVGLKANFALSLDLPITVLILTLACTGKILGASLGSLASEMSLRDSLTVGLGLNARGAMEIVLATSALEYGLINEQIFVALVIMALATTLMTSLTLPKLMETGPISPRAWEPLPLHELKDSYNYFES